MTSRVLVIYNPAAGARRRKRIEVFLSLLTQHGFRYQVAETACPGDARNIARECAGIDVIVAAGGDGTVNEVVDGLCQQSSEAALPKVCFLPLGTANVLRWELGLPRKPCDLIALLVADKALPVRPGKANGRRFVLMASSGMDARAVAGVTGPLKRRFGAGAYILAGFAALTKAPPRLRVTHQGQTHSAATVIATRASRYGGPFKLAPQAHLGQPHFQVLLLHKYGFGAALRYGLALIRGRLQQRNDVTVLTDCVEVHIESEGEEAVQLDGDIAGTLPLAISLEQRAVSFIVPP